MRLILASNSASRKAMLGDAGVPFSAEASGADEESAKAALAEVGTSPRDTADALASGCDGAAVALIERSAQQAHALLGVAPSLLVHGGGAPALMPLLPGSDSHPSLVLDGLARWAVHQPAG